MPELPEVERAAKLLRRVAVGKEIVDVEAVADTIVFTGVDHAEFAAELRGRTVKDAQRYGKVFYLILDGEGRHPVLHFGMTGMLQVKGQLATYYRETPRKASTDWPPRFMKFILHLRSPGGAASDAPDAEETLHLAFLDARRLGRIRLCRSPLTEPPISALGFDPLLSMPGLDDFKQAVRRRTCPVKALLLDQSFSAGVGNWVADEILYHARVHPEERSNALTDAQLDALHTHTSEVCRVAVSVDADDSKFPEDWLFKHRWGKGKSKGKGKGKKEPHTLKLPDGTPATIEWVTVGGRTSAYVAELQKRARAGDAPDLPDSAEDHERGPNPGPGPSPPARSDPGRSREGGDAPRHKRLKRKLKTQEEEGDDDDDDDGDGDGGAPAPARRSSRRRRTAGAPPPS